MMPSARQKAGAVVLAGASLMSFVALWEGDEKAVYKDIVGVPTVCNGHTGPDVKMGDVWTKEQCDAVLVKNLEKHGAGILKCIKVPMNQNQFDAFASLAFNVGVGAVCGSTLVKLLNQGDYDGACRQLLRWNRAGGREVRGLTLRRKAEVQTCLKPMQEPVESTKVYG